MYVFCAPRWMEAQKENLPYTAQDRWDGSRVYFEVLFQMDEGPSFKKVQCVAAVERAEVSTRRWTEEWGLYTLKHAKLPYSRNTKGRIMFPRQYCVV